MTETTTALAMMRAVSGSTVLYPADGNSTVRLVEAMVERPGISYIRTTREKTPKLYGSDEEFPSGGSKVLRQSADDRAAGITLFEALRASVRSSCSIPRRPPSPSLARATPSIGSWRHRRWGTPGRLK